MADCRKVQCRGEEPSGERVPIDSTGEVDFLRERLALYAKATLLACGGHSGRLRL